MYSDHEAILKLCFNFQLATKAVSYFIEHFGMRELFGRENYEYYARLTGRILKVEVSSELEIFYLENEWLFESSGRMDFLHVSSGLSGSEDRH